MTSLRRTAIDPSLPGPPSDGADSSPPAAAPPAVDVTEVRDANGVRDVMGVAAGSDALASDALGGTDIPAASPGPEARSAPGCSITTAAEGCAIASRGAGHDRSCRHDSVPQPRSKEDSEAYLAATTAPTPVVNPAVNPAVDPAVHTAVRPTVDPAAAEGDPTAARLRAAFADRLRAARAEGRSPAELAAACRRPVEEVLALLGEEPGQDHDGEDAPVVGAESESVRPQQPAVAVEATWPGPAQRTVPEAWRSFGFRRPAPSRRLRRMHPRAERTGQEAAERETAARRTVSTGLTGSEARGAERAEALPGAAGSAADHTASAQGAETFSGGSPDAWSGPSSNASSGTGTAVSAVPSAEPETGVGVSRAEPPLGVLIGGGPGQPEAVGRSEERTPVRTAAEPIRVGRGTSLVVLPSWRPAIAVSVSTEQLLTETGLTVEQLPHAGLTVMMNPWAMHDRELGLHGWSVGPAGRRGQARRSGQG
ncbi:hypothetical protein ABT247_14785 [Kitasatospora sp. NPDC001539]|uniref:hypothetical protein n=1 Tax=Kitasatospora sp. NPDC001539 TaxID=3154384 RepID=UPI0033336577